MFADTAAGLGSRDLNMWPASLVSVILVAEMGIPQWTGPYPSPTGIRGRDRPELGRSPWFPGLGLNRGLIAVEQLDVPARLSVSPIPRSREDCR